MAITWDMTITLLDVDERKACIKATRTEDGDVRTFGFNNALIATPEQRTGIMQEIRQQYLKSKIRDTRIADIIGDLESKAKEWLEAQEDGS